MNNETENDFSLATDETRAEVKKQNRNERTARVACTLGLVAGAMLLFHAHETTHEHLWGFFGSAVIAVAVSVRDIFSHSLGYWRGLAAMEHCVGECVQECFAEREAAENTEGGNDNE